MHASHHLLFVEKRTTALMQILYVKRGKQKRESAGLRDVKNERIVDE